MAVSGLDEPSARSGAPASATDAAEYVLTLFVTGASDLSMQAVGAARSLCEEHLSGRYELRVIDVFQNPEEMVSYDVVAAPTLVKESPAPRRMVVGDLSDAARVLTALEIRTSIAPSASR